LKAELWQSPLDYFKNGQTGSLGLKAELWQSDAANDDFKRSRFAWFES